MQDKRKRALLIGNGVNRLNGSKGPSWKRLLEAIKAETQCNVDMDNSLKPFPLAFDEVLHRYPENEGFEEGLRNLKKKISKTIAGESSVNEYHEKLVSVGFDDILTTNYDYNLQLSIDPNFLDHKSRYSRNKQESRHSLKRSYQLPQNRARIWHIHGEVYDSRVLSDGSSYYHEESILIGYSHYVSYLEKIIENVHGQKSDGAGTKNLKARIKDRKDSPYWVDVFFTHDLDMIGQGLDFSENHLWWLINYRANTIRAKSKDSAPHFSNKIRFYFPDLQVSHNSERDKIEIEIDSLRSRAVADLLRAFQVDSVPIRCESYEDFYSKYVETASRQCEVMGDRT